ncbi:bifunctional cytochrome P450/NADPH--P450 reductase [Streptomyces sp. NPDC002845]
MTDFRPIPTPRRAPLVGNTLQIPLDGPGQWFVEVGRRYPEGIFRLAIAGREELFVSDPDLVAEVCDGTRFGKPILPPLSHVRDFAGSGLFTAHDDEGVWGEAHRILMPAFSQRSMKAYFPQMLEIAQELVGKWRRRDGRTVTIADDMTRLTLDTIALSGFGYRFHSFQREDLDPFLQAMLHALTVAMGRTQRPPLVTKLKRTEDRSYRDSIRYMRDLVDGVIRQRRQGIGDGERDLLGLMLGAADPVTGKQLDDANVRDQTLTFLIAGHETTSGLLSFALYSLLRNPHVLAQAYAEVDRLLPGDTVPDYETVMKLDVIPRILDETLRLWSPISLIGKMALEDTVIGGCYHVEKGQKATLVFPLLHTHPKAWERPDEFDIDRWLPENAARHHPHAYKPFGDGKRACIGRQFALTEARLALALILQKFAFSDPSDYQMRIKETLTLKPADFEVRIRLRQDHERQSFDVTPAVLAGDEEQSAAVHGVGVKLAVGYGSTLGSSEDLARMIADRARRAGFDTTLASLDDLADNLPTEGLLVTVAASYNGKAPDNAQRFDELIADGLPEDALSGVRFAVLGVGNTQWQTYQAFPRRIDTALLAAGATPVVERGEVDAAGDFDGMASAWISTLWATLAEEYAADTVEDDGPRCHVELLTESDIRPSIVSTQAYPLTVVASEELVGDPTGLWDFEIEAPRPSARSITVELPEGVDYGTGNHLAVLAKNDPALVARTLDRLGVDRDQMLRLDQADPSGRTHLPVGVPVTAELLLAQFLELQDVATRSQIRTLSQHTPCPWTRPQLEAYTADTKEAEEKYQAEILDKRISVLTLLERFPAVELPLAVFLDMMGPIRPRFYSISSSPMADPRHVRLTVGLVEGPALAGEGEYRGLCSQYLCRLNPGDVFYGYVRVPSPAFAPPAAPSTPLVLIGPGTGIAPLRGFLEERAWQYENGAQVGKSQVFVGCRHPEHDWFYRDEMEQWARSGIAEVHTAFSAVPDHPARFVQNAIIAASHAVWDALENGAHVYVCGDGRRMAPAVREAFAALYRSHTGNDDAAAQQWLAQLEADGRYQQDIFA